MHTYLCDFRVVTVTHRTDCAKFALFDAVSSSRMRCLKPDICVGDTDKCTAQRK